ncbi:MAG: GatB/YqeY domain-containing protein [Anaerolineae bacterium]
MDLKEKLRADMSAAMRSGEVEKRDTIRMLLAAVKQTEVDGRSALGDAGVQAVLAKQAKQRRESIADYEAAGRSELAAQEKRELAVIESYLPAMMGREEVAEIAAGIIAELGVTDIKGMGKVMGKFMAQLKGKADGGLVNQVVREMLQQGQ